MGDGRWLVLGAVAAVAVVGAVAKRRRPSRGSFKRGKGWTFLVSGVVSASVARDYQFDEDDVEIFVEDPDAEMDEQDAREAAGEEYRSRMEGQSWSDLVDLTSLRDDFCVDDVRVREVETLSRPRRSFRSTSQQQRRRLKK